MNKVKMFFKKAKAIRVYEYVSDDGVRYWSFTKHPHIISPRKRLILQDKLGLPIMRFIGYLRTEAHDFSSEDE